MANITDGVIRHAMKRVEASRKQQTLTDGEGRGTGRLVLILKPMPTRVTAEWMAQQWRDGRRVKVEDRLLSRRCRSRRRARFSSATTPTSFRRAAASRSPATRGRAPSPTCSKHTSQHLKDAGKSSWKEAEKGLNKIADTLGRNRLARDIEPDDVPDVHPPYL